MAKHPRDGALVYHFTQLRNLPGIVRDGLRSRAVLKAERVEFADVADEKILEGRAALELDAMVPFHFFAKNPFDYSAVYRAPEERFCLIAVNRKLARSRDWKVLTRHPLAGGELLPWGDGIEAIDWDAMEPEGRDFDDWSTKQTCMAEALSPDAVHVGQFSSVYVKTEDAAVIARSHIRERCHVNVTPGMFPPRAP